MNAAERESVVLDEMSYNLCPGGEGGWGYVNITGRNVYENHKQITVENFKYGNKKFQEKLANSEFRALFSNTISMSLKSRYRNGMKPAFKGKQHTSESLQKMSEKASLRTGSLNSQFGTCWITNGQENKKIKKENLDKYLTLGYYKGRIRETQVRLAGADAAL